MRIQILNVSLGLLVVSRVHFLENSYPPSSVIISHRRFLGRSSAFALFEDAASMADDLAKLQAKNEALRATLMALKAPPAAPVAESTKKAESKLKIIALQEKTFAEQQEIERLELEAKQLLARAKEHSRKKKDIEKEIDVVRNADKPVWETVGMQTITYRDPFHTGVSKRTPTGACSSLLSCCAPRVCGPPSVHPPPAYLPRCVTRISTQLLCRRLLHVIERSSTGLQQPTAPHTVRVAIMLTSRPGRSAYWQAALRSCHRRSFSFLRMLHPPRGVCTGNEKCHRSSV